VPNTPDDYIHRVGRTARAEATGDAFTFVAPDEEPMIKAVERATGKKIQRRVVKDFDYNRQTDEKLEIPLEERIAAIRAKRREDRSRAEARARGEVPPKRGQPHRRRRGGSDRGPRQANG
jgi:ATP-dependent RNA helicase RhlE